MKKIARYRFLTIPKKMAGELRFTVDDRGVERRSTFDGGESVNFNLLPFITLTLMKETEANDGQTIYRPSYALADMLSMTKFNLPVFVNELAGILNDMKIQELYTYHGERLELNTEVGEKIRRVFIVGPTTVELSAVVIDQPDETKVEGIKVKFNNEDSSVLLTLNEASSLLFSLQTLNVDVLCFNMYDACFRSRPKSNKEDNQQIEIPKPVVDIKPVSNDTFSEFLDEGF